MIKYIGLIDIEDNSNFSYDEGDIGTDKNGQNYLYTNGKFAPMIPEGPRPEDAINYLFNHKEEFFSFKDIIDFVYSYSHGLHTAYIKM